MLTKPYAVMDGNVFIGSIEPSGKLCSPMVDYVLSETMPKHVSYISPDDFSGLAKSVHGISVAKFNIYMPTTAFTPFVHDDEQVMAFAPILNEFYDRDENWVRSVRQKGLLFYSHGNSQSGKVELTSVSIGYPTQLNYLLELFYQGRDAPIGAIPLETYLMNRKNTTIELESAVDFGQINKERLQVFEDFLNKLDKPDEDGNTSS